jgi:hypothetical protein
MALATRESETLQLITREWLCPTLESWGIVLLIILTILDVHHGRGMAFDVPRIAAGCASLSRNVPHRNAEHLIAIIANAQG